MHKHLIRRIAYCCVLLACIGAAADASGPIGCYSVELQPLDVPDSPAFEPFAQKSIRLTNEVVMTRRSLAFKVVPLASTPFIYRLAFWRRAGDEVTLTFSEDERAGLRMHLRQTVLGLEGILRSFGGSADIEDVFNVVARRIDCRAPGATDPRAPAPASAAPGTDDHIPQR